VEFSVDAPGERTLLQDVGAAFGIKHHLLAHEAGAPVVLIMVSTDRGAEDRLEDIIDHDREGYDQKEAYHRAAFIFPVFKALIMALMWSARG
jgi:hypothetical protein